MKIYIIPKIFETYKNQLEYSIDAKLIKFLKYVKQNNDIEILYKKKKILKKSWIIFSGGNNIKQFSKKPADNLRDKLDNYYFNLSKNNKNQFKLIGICHGAQFLSKKFGSNLKKIKNKKHIKSHIVFFEKKKIKVNSFHNIVITKLDNKLKSIAIAQDNSTEAFVHKKMKILGIIWHPERYKKFKLNDKKIIKKYL